VQKGLNSGHDLSWVAGLLNEIVRAHLVRYHPFGFFQTGSQHENWFISGPTELPAELESVRPKQAQVQHNQLWSLVENKG
jgi:hypothetical protein